ncbi:MAG: DUF4388 domain-containing protein [Acidimicrobiia bacterium]
MNLSGQLADWTMDDLLQIVQVTKKTGSLDIVGVHKGRVHFREGNITGAELHSSKGVYAGTDTSIIADVVFVLGSMTEGAFAMGRSDGPDVDGVPIEAITGAISELRALEAIVADKGLTDAGDVKLKSTIESEVTISPDDWAAIASLVVPFTFTTLAERLGRGAAIRMVHAFHRLDLVEPAESDTSESVIEPVPGEVSEEESNWLDRLADEVSSTDSTKWLEDAVAEMTAGSDDGAVEAVPANAARAADASVNVEESEAESSDPEVVIAPNEPKDRSAGARGISAPASTTLTTGVYDDIRRLRSKVSE